MFGTDRQLDVSPSMVANAWTAIEGTIGRGADAIRVHLGLRFTMTASHSTQSRSGIAGVMIESASVPDVPALSALLAEGDLDHQAFDRMAIRQGDPCPVERDWLADCIADPDQCVLVARAVDRIVGMVRTLVVHQGASRLRNPMIIGIVEEIVVSRSARREGIGRKLMDEAVAWAKAAGAIRIQLRVYSRNEAARSFYRRLGYGELVHTLHLDLQ